MNNVILNKQKLLLNMRIDDVFKDKKDKRSPKYLKREIAREFHKRTHKD